MFALFANTLSVIEWLSITGLAQSVLILVYIGLRVRSWQQASLALAYFLVIGLAFGLQFALRIEEYENPLRFALWFVRAMGPPLCALLVVQIAKGSELPSLRQFLVLFLAPAALAAGFIIRNMAGVCDKDIPLCSNFFLWLNWLGSIAGGIAILTLWAYKDLFGALRKAKGGMERYWLVIVLVLANIAGVAANFFHLTGSLDDNATDSLLVVLGITSIYLASTTLFRVYPSSMQLSAAPTRFTMQAMTPEEKDLAARVKKLMEVDKLYHEPAFSRADLARELNISENTLSRVINVAFGKSFPQLINEFRVDDAKRMLHDVKIPVQVVASEVGFNSLASFNRAFRDITSLTPSQYRQANATAPALPSAVPQENAS